MALTERTGPLNRKLAAHLLRRSSFRFTKERVDELSVMTASQAVDDLFDNPSPPPKTVRPLDGYEFKPNDPPCKPDEMDWIPQETDRCSQERLRREYVPTWWFHNALSDPQAHHKSAFFLHTIFTTGYVNTNLPYEFHVSASQYDHYRLLNWLCETKASLKEVAFKITLDNLMLGYLDNTINSKGNLNENYAREFLELFTIGRGTQIAPGIYSNYTEADVTEAAKVLSGITHAASRSDSPYYTGNTPSLMEDSEIPHGITDPTKHDDSPKFFSDKFDNQTIQHENSEKGIKNELLEFVEMIFAQDATAENYARKIYRFYIGESENIDIILNGGGDVTAGTPGVFSYEEVIAALAQHLKDNHYDFISTIKKLLKSKHFYDKCGIGSGGGNIIKSPIELLSEAMSFFGADLPSFSTNPTREEARNRYFYFGSYLTYELGLNTGLKLFAPENVAGYPAYYQEPRFDMNWYSPGTLYNRFNIASRLIYWYEALRTRIDTVAYVEMLIEENLLDPYNEIIDADIVINELVTYLFPQEISIARFNLIKTQFIGGTSEQHKKHWKEEWLAYYNIENANADNVRSHLDALVSAVLTSHEFQLK